MNNWVALWTVLSIKGEIKKKQKIKQGLCGKFSNLRQIFVEKTGQKNMAPYYTFCECCNVHKSYFYPYQNSFLFYVVFHKSHKKVAFALFNTCPKHSNMQLLYWVLVFHKSCCSLDWKSHWKSKEPCIRNEWKFTYSKLNYGLWLFTFLAKKNC